MKNCPMCEGVGTIYAGHFQTWEGLVALYELCEACDGTGRAETPVSSQDWQAFEQMRAEAQREDFLEACAGLDSWAYGAQAA